jgi:hypothetical protein
MFADATGTKTSNAASSFAWFEDGVIKVQEAQGKTILRSFAIKEKDATVPRLAMSPDGRWLAAMVEWEDRRIVKKGADCHDEEVEAVRSMQSDFVCVTPRLEVRIFDVREGRQHDVYSATIWMRAARQSG